jgi:DNA mismatch endonuclease (patch repair protein)
LVFRARNAVLFIHGCFWHGHPTCRDGKLPQTRVAYWSEKITGNRRRDARNARRLRGRGWHVLTIWACQLDEKRLDQLYRAIAKIPKTSVSRN